MFQRGAQGCHRGVYLGISKRGVVDDDGVQAVRFMHSDESAKLSTSFCRKAVATCTSTTSSSAAPKGKCKQAWPSPSSGPVCNPQRSVVLTEVLASLLHSLMHDLGRVVPRARLLAGLAPRRRPGETLDARSIDRSVARLRQRLNEQQVDALHITNVRGRRYMLTVLDPPHSLTLHTGAVLRLFPDADVLEPRLTAAH